MLSFLPEMPSAPGPLMPGSGPVLPASGTAGNADFSGLLDAALPQGGAMAAGASALEPPLPAAASLLPAQVPTGKSLPPPGTALPPVTEAVVPLDAAAPPLASPRIPVAWLGERGESLAGAPRAAVPLADVQVEPAPPNPVTATKSEGEDTAQTPPATEPAGHQPPVPPAIAAAPITAPPRPSALTAARPDDTDTFAPTDDPAPGAVLAVLTSPPAPAPAPPSRPEALPLVRTGIAPLPARVMLPATGPAISPASPLTAGDSASAHSAEGLPEALSQPAPPAGQSAASSPLAPGLITASASPSPQPAEPAAAPAPTIEQTIAQADTLREALRAARPEMTVRHAEFGAVSLRLEATGSESWRAVLAARDPGFVPAIQAALAERAITAPDASNFLSQNGTSDQRYGASPNGGQGGHSPHLSQSGTRDGEAAPDHRRPSTAATLAGRDQREAGEEASGSGSARQSRGLFA